MPPVSARFTPSAGLLPARISTRLYLATLGRCLPRGDHESLHRLSDPAGAVGQPAGGQACAAHADRRGCVEQHSLAARGRCITTGRSTSTNSHVAGSRYPLTPLPESAIRSVRPRHRTRDVYRHPCQLLSVKRQPLPGTRPPAPAPGAGGVHCEEDSTRRLAIGQAVPHRHDPGFAFGQSGQHRVQLLLEQGERHHLGRHHCLAVLDQVPELAVADLADRGVQGHRLAVVPLDLDYSGVISTRPRRQAEPSLWQPVGVGVVVAWAARRRSLRGWDKCVAWRPHRRLGRPVQER